MPNMVLLAAGQNILLDQAFAESEAGDEDYVLDLYSNNHTPVITDTAGAFTIATFTGYSQVAIPRSSFAAASVTGSQSILTSSVVPVFSCSGGSGQTVYGFVMRGATSGTAYLAQYFTGGLAVTAGLSVTLYPFQFQLTSQ
jgi:hypothetical protein